MDKDLGFEGGVLVDTGICMRDPGVGGIDMLDMVYSKTSRTRLEVRHGISLMA